MSLEAVLERLAIALEANTKALIDNPQGTVLATTETTEAAAPAKRAAKTKTDPAPAAETKPAATETAVTHTLEDVRASVGDFMKHDQEDELKLRQTWAVSTLAGFKAADGKPAKKAVDLQPKDYAEAIAKFDAELAERNKVLAQSGDNDLLG